MDWLYLSQDRDCERYNRLWENIDFSIYDNQGYISLLMHILHEVR
jgi:hypothetical protein